MDALPPARVPDATLVLSALSTSTVPVGVPPLAAATVTSTLDAVPKTEGSGVCVAVTVVFGVAVAAYYVLMEGLLGQTVGKLVCGIQVVDGRTGGLPGIGKAAVRTLLRLIDGLVDYAVAFVAALSDRRRRRLGDRAAGTLVVRSPH